jgi:hypothetical protein
MKYLHLIIFLLVSNLLTAQSGKTTPKRQPDPLGAIRMKLMFDDSLRRGLGFDSLYKNLVAQLAYIHVKDGKEKITKRFELRYQPDKQAWYIDSLPYGIFEMTITSTAFKPIKRRLLINTPELEWKDFVDVDSLCYTYKDRQKIYYHKGALNFSQTIIVHFAGGDLLKNNALLEKTFKEIAPENIRKLNHMANSWYITIPPYGDLVGTAELLRIAETGEKRAFEGYYLGDIVTQYILKLEKLPNVRVANPTFYNDVKTERKFLDKENIPKSKKFIQKELQALSN